MKTVSIVLFCFLSVFLSSCDKLHLGKKEKTNNDKKGVVMDVIKADALRNTNKGGNEISDMPVMEDQPVGVAVDNKTNNSTGRKVAKNITPKSSKELPYVPEVEQQVVPKSNPSGYETKTLKTKTVVVQPVTVVKVKTPKTVYVNESMMEKKIVLPKNSKKRTISKSSGTIIIIGNDHAGQLVSPRHYKQMSFVVMSRNTRVKYVDFQIFAVNIKNRLTRTGDTMIGYDKHAMMINGQAQFTRYWNGKNIRGKFFTKGHYNIYLLYKLKDSHGRLIARGGRFWGNNRKYYLRLY